MACEGRGSLARKLRGVLLVVAGCAVFIAAHAAPAAPAMVDAQRLIHADAEPGQWMSVARTYSEQRYSPLRAVNTGNVAQLGLAWFHDMDTTRGLEATPVVVDGVMYTTGTWSRVYALDAATGKLLWSYDPKVPRAHAVNLCCDVVNRGVAVWNRRIYVGTLDGRLIALDAATGAPVWSVVTVDQSKPYSITGAPRVIDGKVIIGNGGAEFSGVRGYVTAYDAADGRQIWRFYTVPGNPADNADSPALQRAVKTWSKPGWWRLGGGGPVWNDMAYDPALHLLYFGTGNANPWNRYIRNGASGAGDNLYTASIVAVNVETGKYAWHFQTTPGDAWDYDSDEQLVLATLDVGGAPTPVIMQANKNAFFYVLDRRTGAFISGTPFARQNWTKGLDAKTGRPIPLGGDIYHGESGRVTWPAPFGGHNWQGMAYSPQTGLAYIPVQDVPFLYAAQSETDFKPVTPGWGTAMNLAAQALPAGLDPLLQSALYADAVAGKLVAWDPLRRRAAWTVEHALVWNGGTLATAGGLVFQGTAAGNFRAYDATSGTELWRYKLPNGVIAAPMTYTVDGTQYVALMMGWGGSAALAGGMAVKWPGRDFHGYLLVFKLGGAAQLPAPQPFNPGIPDPPKLTATAAQVKAGNRFYNQRCAVCHGVDAVSGSSLPDLRYLPNAMYGKGFEAVVLGGVMANAGMASFADVATRQDIDDVQAYLIKRATETRVSLRQPGWWARIKTLVFRAVAPLANWLNGLLH
ncbi:MAG: PQQ-dependent dehydrogenase, methanol/ethanol family [Nevskiaceae bacterium]|nr:MAG: PQQ-dependent dehydrogenase, methanol/ethanol family [Nevskiaceae bacterium]TBR71678.1 MAG: PQQ-dependent dehydrogenase, methanol/ethanol family [Nevskiaceae bacterium]